MSHLTRRTLLAAGAGLAAGSLTRGALAADWPAGQTIKIIVPFAAGGSVDAIARLVQPGLQQRLGATVIVENRAGGGGAVGAAAVAKAAPDGLTWLFVFDSHAVLPSLMKLTFDAEKDLDPVMLIGTAPMVLACNPARPFKTFSDVVAASKAKPDSLTYGTVGNGSLGHLEMILLQKRAGFEARHLPYRGGGPAINDALAGHIDLVIGSAALVTPHVEGGKLRPLVQTGPTRIAALPDVQTIAEAGYPGAEADAWWGAFGRAGTPKAMVDRMEADLRATFSDPMVRERLEKSQQIKVSLGGPDVLRPFFAQQMKTWGGVVRENGIKPD